MLAQCDSILVFPYPGSNGFCRYKPFPPIETASGIMRYYQPPGSGNHLYVLPPVTAKLHDTSVPLFLVEGEKKAASLVERGYTGGATAGLWNWKGADSWDGIPELKEIPFVDREVVIVPDNDIWTKSASTYRKPFILLENILRHVALKYPLSPCRRVSTRSVPMIFLPLVILPMNLISCADYGSMICRWHSIKHGMRSGKNYGRLNQKVKEKTLPAFMTDTEPSTEAVNTADLLNESSN